MRREVRFKLGYVVIYEEVKDEDTGLICTDKIVLRDDEKEKWNEIKEQVDKYFEIVRSTKSIGGEIIMAEMENRKSTELIGDLRITRQEHSIAYEDSIDAFFEAIRKDVSVAAKVASWEDPSAKGLRLLIGRPEIEAGGEDYLMLATDNVILSISLRETSAQKLIDALKAYLELKS